MYPGLFARHSVGSGPTDRVGLAQTIRVLLESQRNATTTISVSSPLGGQNPGVVIGVGYTMRN